VQFRFNCREEAEKSFLLAEALGGNGRLGGWEGKRALSRIGHLQVGGRFVRG
jgi:hypothetical protein